MDTKKKSKSLWCLVLLMPYMFFLYDTAQIKKAEKSIFTIPVVGRKDGGTKFRIGIGYGVYDWKKLATAKVNGKSVNGYMVGSEIIIFPDCYNMKLVFDYEPKITLKFIAWNEVEQ